MNYKKFIYQNEIISFYNIEYKLVSDISTYTQNLISDVSYRIVPNLRHDGGAGFFKGGGGR